MIPLAFTRSVIAALTSFLATAAVAEPPTEAREQLRSEVTHRDDSDKTARRAAVAHSHRIVMQVGFGRQVRRLERMGCRRVPEEQ